MKETLLEIQAELTEAYALLAMILVRDTDVDRMAEARTRLRKAFQTLKEAGKEAGGNG